MGSIPLPKQIILFRGYMDLRKIYKFIFDWLKRRSYETYETKYRRKKAEIELTVMGERKVNEYIKDIIIVDMHLYGDGPGPSSVDEVEVVKDGVKRKMIKGRMHLTINGIVETGYKNIYGKSMWNTPFLQKLQRFLETGVLKQELDLKYVDPLYYEVLEFFEALKKEFEMDGIGSFY